MIEDGATAGALQQHFSSSVLVLLIVISYTVTFKAMD